MEVTASVVVYDSPREEILNVARNLLASEVRRIYFIHNYPDEGTCLPELADEPRIDWRHVENRGFGSGHNIALREVCEDDPEGCHLVLNADTEWSPGVVERLVRRLSEDRSIGMIAPKVVLPDGQPQINRRRLPSPLDLIARRFNPFGIFNRRLSHFMMEDVSIDEETEAPYLLGCFFLLRNSAVLECGGFDERFFLYPEDIDLTRRINMRWKTLYCPEVAVVHRHEAASRRSLRMLWVHVSNMVRYYRKWHKSF